MAERLLENITPNSDKYRSEKTGIEEKRVIRKVNVKNVQVKKKSLLSGFLDTFIREKPKDVGKYVFSEVIVPAIMDTIYDAITNAVSMTFYHKAGKRRPSDGNSIGSRFNYNAISSPSIRKEKTPVYGGSKGGLRSFRNLVFESKGEAEEVRDSMLEYIDKYGSLSVLNFYDIAQVSMDDCEFTDNNWGWKRDSIGQMKVIGDVANGFYINLPRCEPID